MQSQIDLLKSTDWRVLVVLDACRADYFERICATAGLPSRAVRSPGNDTPHWLRKVVPQVLREPLEYFTANPVVDREIGKMNGTGHVKLHPVWEHGWGRHTELQIPTVHPAAVNDAVLGHVSQRGQPERMIVHYLQPHSPYIGETTPLKMARWGRGKHGLIDQCHKLPRPDMEAFERRLDWGLLHEAYADNLRLVWKWALRLIESLAGTILVTADHGEVLGEHGGKFGHEPHWIHFPELYEVPWLAIDRPAKMQNPDNDRSFPNFRPESVEDAATKRKLEALGYE